MARHYQAYREKISLRAFCRLTGYPRWRLRYYLASEHKRQERQKLKEQEHKLVKETALKHKTFGYRGIYKEVNKLYKLGREKVRKHMRRLDLHKALPKKKRKPAPAVSSVCDLPAGRRLQIDATRFELSDGIAWKYVVEDVASRACLALHTVRRLSKEAAATALLKAQTTLAQLDITETLVIQSDGGTDFTSQYFQDTCSSLAASWHRCRVNEKGGMGILERLNRTLKWDFIFWHLPETFDELGQLDNPFQNWYNQERIHSSINYLTPWQRLLQDARLSSPLG